MLAQEILKSELVASIGKFLNQSFVSQVVGTAIGALLAFYFGLQLYRHQKQEENRTTLLFFISSLTSISSNLYALKEQMVQHRYKECLECKKIIENSPKPHLQIKEMSQYIFTAHPEWPMPFDRLEFLALADPNVIVLSGTLKNSLATLGALIENINNDITRIMKDNDPTETDILMMIRKNELLYEQLDSTLYLNSLLSDVLIKYGRIQFRKRMKIKSTELTEDKYKALAPKPIESWSGHEWFPQKKKWWKFWQ